MKQKIEIIDTPHQTNFFDIFKHRHVSLWHGIFKNVNWEVILIKRTEYLFSDSNSLFLDKLGAFSQETENKLFTTCSTDPGEKPHYSILNFPATIPLTEICDLAPGNIGQEILVNWQDDLIWGDSGKFGLYSSSYYWIMALGFLPEIAPIVRKHIMINVELVDTKYLYDTIDETYYKFRQIPLIEQSAFTNMIKTNNHWVPDDFGEK